MILHGRAEIRNLSSSVEKYFNTYYINTNEIPKHLTFCCEKHDLLGNRCNGDLFTCEDIVFSRESSPGISLVFI